jgi:hypothetical protein
VEPVVDEVRAVPDGPGAVTGTGVAGVEPSGVRAARQRSWARLATTVALAAALVGIILRWWPRSVLWLDEAQSVSFSSLPLAEIPSALREDGAPPAYYALLHLWMRLVGDGDAAVRAFSAVLSTVTIAVLVPFVRRRWTTLPPGRCSCCWPRARSPSGTRRTRACTPWWCWRWSSDCCWSTEPCVATVGGGWRGRPARRCAPVHPLLGVVPARVTAGALLVTSRDAPPGSATRRARRRTALAVLAGFVAWAPWVPTFIFQGRRTATPWRRRRTQPLRCRCSHRAPRSVVRRRPARGRGRGGVPRRTAGPSRGTIETAPWRGRTAAAAAAVCGPSCRRAR